MKSRSNYFLLDMLERRMLFAAATVNFGDVRQTIDGFGAASAWSSGTIPAATLDQIYSPITGAGLSLLRSRIQPSGGSSENQMMQQVGAYGVRAWSTPWTMPREYKTNHDNNNGGNLDPAHYQDYANQIANYVQDMTRQGIPLYAVSIQNEPNWTATYESARWDASSFAAFLPYLGQTFASRGITTTKIMLPEELNWDFSYASTIMANPALAQYVGILAAHNYGETSTSWKPVSIANGKPVWETEFTSNQTAEWDTAIDEADDIYQAMTLANANAYHYWWLSSNNTTSGLTSNWTPTKRLWAMGQYSRFVRPGWVRVGETDDGGLDITTFKDPASGKFAIVTVNKSTTNAVTESFTLSGLTANSVTPYVTSSTENLAAQTAITLTGGGTTFSATIAASSIQTFYGVSATVAAVQAPGNLMAVPQFQNTTTRIALSWTDNSSGETNYTVERSIDGSNWTVVTSTLAADTRIYVDTGRTENTKYFYRVKPTNGDATTYSAVASTSTIIQAPSSVNGTRNASGINLTWIIGSTTSTGVTIDRSLDGVTWTNIATLTTRATSYPDVIPGYSSGQIYFYRVRNTASSGSGSTSAQASWNTGLTAPTSFSAAQVTATTVTFTWGGAQGASGAWIEQFNSATSAWSVVSPSSLRATDGTWTLSGLSPTTPYSFRMRASAQSDNVYSAYTGSVAITTPFQPIWYKANENSGTTLNDSFATSHNAALSGSASFTTGGVSGNALVLSGGYAALPSGIVSGVNDFTIASWVKLSALGDGARLFDFGTGAANSMYLTAQAPGTAGLPQFVTTSGAGSQQITSSIPIALNAWTHIAVTLSGNSATMYINGVVAGTNSAMTIHPSALGSTTQNYLGKSQGAEPVLLGSVDDFEIYGRAFSTGEVQALATPSTQLAWYKADESLGGVLSDSSGAHNDATLGGSFSFIPSPAGNAVSISGGAANLPTGIVGGLNNFTIAGWVKLSSLDTWARVFDFGTSTTNYMFLTPKANSGLPRFAINAGSGEQAINSNTALSLDAWTHFAVTLSGNTAALYINGAVVGTNSNLTTHPAALGATTKNYLGDSQFSADPSLQGNLDDVRIYSRALTTTEVQQLVYPTIASSAAAGAMTATTAALSVLGADQTEGEAKLTYTWSVTGTPPAPVAFSSNGSNAAKNTTATFTRAGTYNFLVTVTNAANFSVTSSVSVFVSQTPTTVSVSPTPVTVAGGNTRQFGATVLDQFGQSIASPSVSWSATGGGSVDSSGLFTASQAGGSFNVTATSGSAAGSAIVNVVPTIYTGSSSADNYYIRLASDGVTEQVWVGSSSPGGSPSYTIARSQLPSLTFNGIGGGDGLTVDFTNGNPVPASGLAFNAGSSVNGSLLLLDNSGSADTATLTSNAVIFNTAAAISYASVQSLTISTAGGNDTVTQASQPLATAVAFNGGGGSDTLNVHAGTFAFANDAASGTASLTVNVANTGSAVTFSGSQHLAALNISAAATAAMIAAPSPAAAAIMTVSALTVTGTGSKLDVANNELLVGGALSSVRAQIAAGQMWSSTANALGSLDLGNNQIEVRATIAGDTNLDGIVDVTDIGNLASNYGIASGAVWADGDLNYDSAVNVTDLGGLASNYGANLGFGGALTARPLATHVETSHPLVGAGNSRPGLAPSAPFANQRIVIIESEISPVPLRRLRLRGSVAPASQQLGIGAIDPRNRKRQTPTRVF